MNRSLLISLSLISLINLPCLASSTTIKKGDTLTKIAAENNLTIKEIMDENEILDANNIKVGQKIKLPIKTNDYDIHFVKKGENLNQISNLYNTSKANIISINNLENPNFIYQNQRLYVPKGEASQNASADIKVSTEESSTITESINLSKNQPQEIKELDKKETEKNSQTWKSYGPLKINWSSWKSQDGNFVANTIHKSGKPLFIAVNCSKRILNRTGKNGDWRDWIIPREEFEEELLDDLCKNKNI